MLVTDDELLEELEELDELLPVSDSLHEARVKAIIADRIYGRIFFITLSSFLAFDYTGPM